MHIMVCLHSNGMFTTVTPPLLSWYLIHLEPTSHQGPTQSSSQKGQGEGVCAVAAGMDGADFLEWLGREDLGAPRNQESMQP